MIKVDIELREDEALIRMEGHAGYADPGKDIVCAGVSTLTYSLLNVIEETKSGDIKECLAFQPYAKTVAKIKYLNKDECRSYLNFFKTGIKMVALSFPDYVSLKQ